MFKVRRRVHMSNAANGRFGLTYGLTLHTGPLENDRTYLSAFNVCLVQAIIDKFSTHNLFICVWEFVESYHVSLKSQMWARKTIVLSGHIRSFWKIRKIGERDWIKKCSYTLHRLCGKGILNWCVRIQHLKGFEMKPHFIVPLILSLSVYQSM